MHTTISGASVGTYIHRNHRAISDHQPRPSPLPPTLNNTHREVTRTIFSQPPQTVSPVSRLKTLYISVGTKRTQEKTNDRYLKAEEPVRQLLVAVGHVGKLPQEAARDIDPAEHPYRPQSHHEHARGRHLPPEKNANTNEPTGSTQASTTVDLRHNKQARRKVFEPPVTRVPMGRRERSACGFG